MQVDAVAPGLFMVDQPRLTPAAISVHAGPDGSQTFRPVFECSPPASCAALPIAGRYLSFYGTGFRNATRANVKCAISGVPVAVEYGGPQGAPGLDQINVRLPDDDAVIDASGNFFWDMPYGEVTLSIDGTPANAAVLLFPRQR